MKFGSIGLRFNKPMEIRNNLEKPRRKMAPSWRTSMGCHLTARMPLMLAALLAAARDCNCRIRWRGISVRAWDGSEETEQKGGTFWENVDT